MSKLLGRLVTIALLSTILSCTSGGSDSDSGRDNGAQFSGSCALKITNGETCSSGKGPVALLIIYGANNQPSSICTGAFISKRHVLSAAHCVSDGPPRIDVVVEGETVSTNTYFFPPRFRNVEGDNDLDYSVVTLPREIPDVETLPLLVSEGLSVNETVNIVDFGQDENGNDFATGVEFNKALKKGVMRVAEVDPNSQGGVFFAFFDSTRQAVCSGDSGGPAIVLNRDGLPGIVGVAEAISDPSAPGEEDTPRCLEGSIAIFTLVQNGKTLSDIMTIVPGVGLI